jgi:hypothetical protein
MSRIHPKCPDSDPSDRRVLPMSSFDKCQTRKKRKTKAPARKMTMTTQTRDTQSERALIYFSG